MSPAVIELSADQDLPVAGHAGFLVGKSDGVGKTNGENNQRDKISSVA